MVTSLLCNTKCITSEDQPIRFIKNIYIYYYNHINRQVLANSDTSHGHTIRNPKTEPEPIRKNRDRNQTENYKNRTVPIFPNPKNRTETEPRTERVSGYFEYIKKIIIFNFNIYKKYLKKSELPE